MKTTSAIDIKSGDVFRYNGGSSIFFALEKFESSYGSAGGYIKTIDVAKGRQQELALWSTTPVVFLARAS